MPSNFPLGQLSSPTTGIFPGQAPAMGVYTNISTAAPSACVYELCVHANICYDCLYIM